MLQQEIVFKELNPFQNFELVKNIWLSIEKNAETNFYLSWCWMESWLKSLSDSKHLNSSNLKHVSNQLVSDVNICFIYAEKNKKPVFCYFLGLQADINSKIIYAKRAYLNKVGDPKMDTITIEHNGILIDKNFAASGFTDVFQKSKKWDELVATFITPIQEKYFVQLNKHLNYRIEEDDKAFKIELDTVRSSKNDLLPLLSRNRRAQIKRTIKAYQQDGLLGFDIETDLKEKINTFEHLKELHQKNWQAKGKSGAFESEYINRFHDLLIKNSYENSRVEVFRVHCGKSPIGYLYFLIKGRYLYFYQSAFKYRDKNNFRPGLLTHYFAINHYAKLGYITYDFLVGDMNYKNSLTTESYSMKSYRLRTNKFRFKFEGYLRKIVAALSS